MAKLYSETLPYHPGFFALFTSKKIMKNIRKFQPDCHWFTAKIDPRLEK